MPFDPPAPEPWAPTPSLPPIDRVVTWLRDRGQPVEPTSIEVIPGGRSNVTYRLLAGDRRLVVRHPPAGQERHGAHDVHREYRITSALNGTAVPVPRPVAFCDDPAVIGVPFSVVEFVEGVTLRSPRDLTAIPPAGRANITATFARTLAALHAVDPAVAGMPVDKGWNFVARQLTVWGRQLQAPPVRALPVMDEVAARLRDSAPVQARVAIVHGDYRLDNVLLGPQGEIRAVVDWELWTLGDPLADLGVAVAYWADSPLELAPLGTSPTLGRGLGDRRALLEAYADATGTTIDDGLLGWYVAFGLWRFAAILEGVYRRNLSGAYGERGNDDWWRYEHVVPALAEVAAQQLEAVM